MNAVTRPEEAMNIYLKLIHGVESKISIYAPATTTSTFIHTHTKIATQHKTGIHYRANRSKLLIRISEHSVYHQYLSPTVIKVLT